MEEKEEFSGYGFDKEYCQNRMKYVIISQGDLDINNAYAVESDEDLLSHLKESYREPIAVIKIDKFIKFKKTTEEIVKVELNDAEHKLNAEETKNERRRNNF